MKSMLHEASSVTRAIEKAWADAGKPNEFTIKILEQGEKNFFGLSKHPAIVSITYQPKVQPTRQQDLGKLKERKPPVAAQNTAKNVPLKTAPSNLDTKNQIRPLQKREIVNSQQNKHVQSKPGMQEQEKTHTPHADVVMWQDEWVVFISKHLKELLSFWGESQGFTTKVSKKTLTITLDEPLHNDITEERAVFISFSYLLVQFFKCHYKRKFHDFQLIIVSKKPTT
jgi:hypothetical protein